MPGASATAASNQPAEAEELLLLHPAESYAAADYAQTDETEIIKLYAPVVKSMATHMKGRLPTSVQLEDLIQAGMIAVLRLVRVGYLARFGEGPLRRSIRNAMIDEARRESWAPVRIIRRAKAAANAMRELEGRLGRHATDEELAAEMALSLAEYHELLVEVAGIRLLELDEIIDREEDLATGTDNPEATLHHDRIVAALAGAVESLPDREKLVVSLYYERNLNMDEVGEILGFDKSTVCRAHGRALLMLRSALQGWK
ncbi:MAG TPA: sigma-70 family RNA polymerase sigma factor [Stellaceae bacterium]|nr:sigma-70 family RNA polymerase sigma factor [Stellaceae bacterium]